MQTYRVFVANEPSSGNPASVLEINEENTVRFQKIAAELKFPVSVFLLPPLEANGLTRIRFFYPQRETNICVHGALAAACHLLKESKTNSMGVVNKEDVTMLLSKEQNQYFVSLDKAESIEISFNQQEILKMLNIDSTSLELSLPFKVASVGSPKLLVPVKNLSILKKIQPQFDKITRWSIQNKVNGLYVYTSETLEKSANFHARNFNPQTGINEDIATGIAAAALAASINETNHAFNFCIEQGYFLGNPCLIYVQIANDTFKVGGSVRTLS